MYCHNCGNKIEDDSAKCYVCGTYRKGCKSFSWLGFIFSTFYYAGKNIKKAIIITTIYTVIACTLDYFFITNQIYQTLSGTMFFVAIGTYVGISVIKEPSYIQQKFNWFHANTFALVTLVPNFIYQIYTLKFTDPEQYKMLMQVLGIS